MKILTEMTEAQRAALELYLEVDTDYRAPSFSVIAERLEKKGFSSSKSTVQRWSKECDFEAYLERHVNALIAVDEQNNKDLREAAGDENFKRTLLSLEDNSELTSGSYKGLKLVLQQILKSAESGRNISEKDAKLLIQIYSISSARDDKLLDRQAALTAVDRLTKADLLKQFAGTGVDLEALSEGEEFTDVEIDD
ncbi:MAG: hypothetical protein AB7D34_01280 [Sulfurimonas sp.]